MVIVQLRLAINDTMWYRYEWEESPYHWYLLDNSWNYGADCTSVVSSSFAHFQNTDFGACYPNPNDTYYEPNAVAGYADGSGYWSFQWRKSGACSDLLSFESSYSTARPPPWAYGS